VNVSSFCLLRALQNVFELARACRRELLFMVLELLLGRVAADSIDTGPAVFALGSGNHNTDALQDPATWLRQLMGVESHLSTRSGPSGGASSPIVSARGGRSWYGPWWDWRCKAQHRTLNHSYLMGVGYPRPHHSLIGGRLSRWDNLLPKLERHPSSNE
jgi:hypothetical protein